MKRSVSSSSRESHKSSPPAMRIAISRIFNILFNAGSSSIESVGGGPSGLRGANADEGGGPSGLRGANADVGGGPSGLRGANADEGGGPSGLRGANAVDDGPLFGATFTNTIVVYSLEA